MDEVSGKRHAARRVLVVRAKKALAVRVDQCMYSAGSRSTRLHAGVNYDDMGIPACDADLTVEWARTCPGECAMS